MNRSKDNASPLSQASGLVPLGNAEERIVGRFEKVLRFYWDGLPTPPLVESDAGARPTFVLRLLGFSPDYYGETIDVDTSKIKVHTTTFHCLAERGNTTTSISARIGSHYSPLVGVFSFSSQPVARGTNITKTVVRIPYEPCEGDSTAGKSTTSVMDETDVEFRMDVRMARLVSLYEPLIKESTPIDRQMLRNIVILATEGLRLQSKEWVITEVGSVMSEYVTAQCIGIYYYMCMDPLYNRLLKPLQLRTAPPPRRTKIFSVDLMQRPASRRDFLNAKQQLNESLMWNECTRPYFTALHFLWDSRFKRLILFDLRLSEWATGATAFVAQLTESIKAAVTRIRIEFYSKIEEHFFSLIPSSRDVLLMSQDELERSRFCRVFKATRFFLFNALRELIFENMEKLTEFFECDGHRGNRISKMVARRHPVLYTELVVGASNLPQIPDLTSFFFNVAGVLDNLVEGVNSLPGITASVMRTLRYSEDTMNVISEVELVYFRSVLFDIFDEVTASTDELRAAYTRFTLIPVKDSKLSSEGSTEQITHYVSNLQETVGSIQRCSQDVVFCGCFAVDCRKVKALLTEGWTELLASFYSDIEASIWSITSAANKKCEALKKELDVSPNSVKELENFVAAAEQAKSLSAQLKEVECQAVIGSISCMEQCHVAVPQDLYASCVQLMRWPAVLDAAVANVESVRSNCGPQLASKLKEMREEVAEYVKTLSTGITELYNMFTLDICDIAAQTCHELRELVTTLLGLIDEILYQEKTLGIVEAYTFDNVFLLVNYFDTIEQFWTTINRASSLHEYYATSINRIDSEKMVESVREWRRLIHSATRNLRSFEPLVTLGRQQEVALARFEALEPLLHAITSPGMRKTHWKEICRLLTPKAHEDIFQILNGVASLRTVLDAGIDKCSEAVFRITEQARCEHVVESELEEMKSLAKKTHFELDVQTKSGGAVMTTFAEKSSHDIIVQLESCVRRCQRLQKELRIGAISLGNVHDWETATEKTRRALQDSIATLERWDALVCYHHALVQRRAAGELGPGEQPVLDHLMRAAEALATMFTTLTRPQFSLYMAVVQDTIQDQSLIAANSMTAATGLLEGTMVALRETYPRFHFLSNAQLLSFLSPHNTERLGALLPYMFTQLASVEVTDGGVVAFSTGDGAVIRATRPIPLDMTVPGGGKKSPANVAEWMIEFEAVLRDSVLAAIRRSVFESATLDLQVWLEQCTCAQSAVMGLRVTHTKDMREALRLSRGAGLPVCRTRTHSLLAELFRIISTQDLDFGAVQTAVSAVTYCQHMLTEVEHALKNRITTTTELDATAMLQTFLLESEIHTRVLGRDFEYACEFIGNYYSPFLTPEVLDKTLCTQLFSTVGHHSPVLCGGDVCATLLDFLSTFFGRYVVRVQCGKWLTPDALGPVIRGAVSCGALLCFLDCDAIPEGLRETVIRVVEETSVLILSERETLTASLPVGPGGQPTNVPVHPNFNVLFTARSYSLVPRHFSVKYRPLHLPELDLAALVRSFVYAYGLDSSERAVLYSARFASFFQAFRAADPASFTPQSLLSVLRHATLIQSSDTTLEKLCESFSRVFYGALRASDSLMELLEWSVKNTLNIATSSVFYDRLMASFKPHARDLYSRFADLMISHQNVIVLGAAFSGKTRLWRRWVGNAKCSVFAPSLVTSADLFGTATQPGLLSAMAKNCVRGSANYIVVEDSDMPHRLLTDWLLRSRVPVTCGDDFVYHTDTRVIASVRSIADMNPSQLIAFGLFSMLDAPDWRQFLRGRLRGAPRAEVACRFLEVCVPVVYRALRHMQYHVPTGSGNASGSASPTTGFGYSPTGGGGGGGAAARERDADRDNSPELLAACQRCCSLYHLWHRHAKQVTRTDGDERLPLSEDAYAAQCAIFAAFWAQGHAAPPDDQPVLLDALRRLRPALAQVAEELDVREELLPLPGAGAGHGSGSGNGDAGKSKSGGGGEHRGSTHDGGAEEADVGVLSYVVTPLGWVALERAESAGFRFLWSDSTFLSPQSPAWTQMYALPSRRPTLRALECLVLSGQSVLLSGEAVTGKSTVLRSLRYTSLCVPYVVTANIGFNPTTTQQGIAERLSKRSTGVYGPMMGRRLVVCVDDIHLSARVSGELPTAGRMIAFCDKYSAINTPATGFISTVDTQFLATAAAGEHFGASLEACCVRVLLPALEGRELVQGAQELFEATCAKRRVEELPALTADFLTQAHHAFTLVMLGGGPLFRGAPGPVSSAAGNGNSSPNSVQSNNDNSGAEAELREAAVAGLLTAPEAQLFRYRDALRAVDAARVSMLLPTNDVQVIVRTVQAVPSIYTPYVTETAADRVDEFQAAVADAAERTLRRCIPRSDVSFRQLIGQRAGLRRDKVSAADWEAVANWIDEMHASATQSHVDVLEGMFAQGDGPAAEAAAEALRSSPERVKYSYLIRYPPRPSGRGGAGAGAQGGGGGSASGSLLGASARRRSSSSVHHNSGAAPLTFGGAAAAAAAGGAGAGGGGPLGSSGRTTSTSSRIASRRGSRSAASEDGSDADGLGGGSGGARGLEGAAAARRHPLRYLSRTYQTTWLTASCLLLHRCLVENDNSVALVDDSTFGFSRLLHLVSFSTRLPLAVLRRTGPDYDSDAFKREMRSVIIYACLNRCAVAVVVHQSVLSVGSVINYVDFLVRTGEASDILTGQEMAALAKGCAPARNSNFAPLTPTEETDFRSRLRRLLRFVLHTERAEDMARLARAYPSVARMTAVNIHTPDGGAQLKRELVASILYEDETVNDDLRRREIEACGGALVLSEEQTVELVCDIYTALEAQYPMRLEQLIAFARCLKVLREKNMVEMHKTAHRVRVLAGRGDTAVTTLNEESRTLRQATSEILSTKAKTMSFKMKLKMEEKRRDTGRTAAEAAKLKYEDNRRANESARKAAEDKQREMNEEVAATAARLRRVKQQQVDAMGTSRLPDKGALLLKAIYKLMQQELPKVSAQELWHGSIKEIATKEFATRFSRLSPASVEDVSTLVPLATDLANVNFGKTLTYANLLARFIVDYVECARYRLEVTDARLAELAEAEKALEAEAAALTELEKKVTDAEAKLAQLTAEETEVAQQLEKLLEVQRLHGAREKNLQRYVSLIDSFARFSSPERVGVTATQAKNAEGDVMLLAAYFTVTGMQEGVERANRDVWGLVRKRGLPVSSMQSTLFFPLLYPEHEGLVERFISPALTDAQRIALASIRQRIGCRWTAFGGVSPMFAAALDTTLRLQCTGCTTVSVFDPDLYDQILSALKEGEGVVVRDVYDRETFNRVRPLLPLYDLIVDAYRRRTATLPLAKEDTRTATESEQNVVRIPFVFLGEVVEVHPKFFLVCTSEATLSTQNFALCRHMDVVNFFSIVPTRLRVEELLLRAPISAHIVDQITTKQNELHGSVHYFMRNYDSAATLLQRDLEHFAAAGPADLDLIDYFMGEVGIADVEMAQYTNQLRSLRKQHKTLSAELEKPLKAAEEAMRFIEGDKLGRPWDSRMLDLFVAQMWTLPAELSARIAPRSFGDLPASEKCFYALANYMEQVLQCFACGWPDPLRGILALLFFTATVTAAESILRPAEGALFPKNMSFLNATQCEALRCVLSGNNSFLEKSAAGAGPHSSAAAPPALPAPPLTGTAGTDHEGSAAATATTTTNNNENDNNNRSSAAEAAGASLRREDSRASEEDEVSRFIVAVYKSSGDALLRQVAEDFQGEVAGFPTSWGNRFTSGDGGYDDAEPDAPPSDGGYESTESNGSFTYYDFKIADFFSYVLRCDFRAVNTTSIFLVSQFFAAVRDSESLQMDFALLALEPERRLSRADVEQSAIDSAVRGGRVVVKDTAASASPAPPLSLLARQQGPTQPAKGTDASGGNGNGNGNGSGPNPNDKHNIFIPQFIHSRAVLLQRAVRFLVPVCSVTQYPDTAIKLDEQQSARVKYQFQWFSVRTRAEFHAVTVRVMRCFYQRPSSSGYWLTVHLDFPVDGLRDSAENRRLVQHSLQVFLALLSGRHAVEAAGRGKGIHVYVSLIFSYAAQQFLWSRKGPQHRVFFSSHDFLTPVRQLRGLLTDDVLLRRSAWELPDTAAAAAGGEGAGDSKSGSVSGAGGTTVRAGGRGRTGGASFRSTGSYHSRGSHSGGPGAVGRARQGSSAASLRSIALTHVARLVAKEIVVMHVGFSERQRLLTEEWRHLHHSSHSGGGSSSSGGGAGGGGGVGAGTPVVDGSSAANVLFGARTGDDTVSMLLLLLERWLRSSERLLTRISERGSRGSATLTGSMIRRFHALPAAGAAGAADSSAPGGSSPGLLAYYYFRNRKWLELHDHRSLEATDEELLFLGTEFLVGSDSYSATEKIELVESYYSRMVFFFFQKLTYQLMTSSDLPPTERRAVRWMIQRLIVSPSGNGSVNCNLTDCDVEPLLVDDSESFSAMLDGATSDMVELCGSTAAVRTHEERETQRIRRLLFTLTPPIAYGAPGTTTGGGTSASVAKRLGDIFSSSAAATRRPTRDATFEGDDEYCSLYWRLERAHLRALFDFFASGGARETAAALQWQVAQTARTLLDSDEVDHGAAPLGLPIPLLHSPRNTLLLVSAARQARLRSGDELEYEQTHSSVLDKGTASELMIVVTLRRLLQPHDVVLTGATPSTLLEKEMRSVTGWDAESHPLERPPPAAVPTTTQRPRTRKGTSDGSAEKSGAGGDESSLSAAPGGSDDADGAGGLNPEAIVVAVRCVGVKHGAAQRQDAGVSMSVLPSFAELYHRGPVPTVFSQFPHPSNAMEFLWETDAEIVAARIGSPSAARRNSSPRASAAAATTTKSGTGANRPNQQSGGGGGGDGFFVTALGSGGGEDTVNVGGDSDDTDEDAPPRAAPATAAGPRQSPLQYLISGVPVPLVWESISVVHQDGGGAETQSGANTTTVSSSSAAAASPTAYSPLNPHSPTASGAGGGASHNDSTTNDFSRVVLGKSRRPTQPTVRRDWRVHRSSYLCLLWEGDDGEPEESFPAPGALGCYIVVEAPDT